MPITIEQEKTGENIPNIVASVVQGGISFDLEDGRIDKDVWKAWRDGTVQMFDVPWVLNVDKVNDFKIEVNARNKPYTQEDVLECIGRIVDLKLAVWKDTYDMAFVTGDIHASLPKRAKLDADNKEVAALKKELAELRESHEMAVASSLKQVGENVELREMNTELQRRLDRMVEIATADRE